MNKSWIFKKLFTKLFFVAGSYSVSAASQIPATNDMNMVDLQTSLAKAIQTTHLPMK